MTGKDFSPSLRYARQLRIESRAGRQLALKWSPESGKETFKVR
jgi:hypothetical protein